MSFFSSIQNYPKENIPRATYNAVKKIINQEAFNPKEIERRGSQDAAALARWCIALKDYTEALSVLKPKQEKVAQMQEIYNDAMAKLKVKQDELNEINNQIAAMEEEFEET